MSGARCSSPLRLALGALLLGLAVGCAAAPRGERPEPVVGFDYELPPGEYGIVPLPPGEPMPDFSIGWRHRDRLLEAVDHSLAYLDKPSSREFFPADPEGRITHERMRASLERFRELLTTSTSQEELREALAREFEVWVARGRGGSGDVYFTAYGTPILEGSLEPAPGYEHPLYRVPPDLEKGPDGAILGRRLPDGTLAPYPTHAELLRSGQLDGLELVWLKDPFDAYVAQVQGSAVVRLPDGSLYEVGYAGKNGHPYRSIGRILVEEGKIPANELSLARLQRYFDEHPEEVDRVLPMNPSFVFFQEAAGGPYGCLGQPVEPLHSIATDKEVFPRAGLAYVECWLPDFTDDGRLVQRPFRFFALDQDRGGAIRSAGRCDVYLGLGDDAMERAGRVWTRGRLYYLLLKSPSSLAASAGRPRRSET